MMDLNKDKYYVEGADVLSEPEKLQMAKDLLELEGRGVIEYHDGRWRLAAGVEIEGTPGRPVIHFRNKKERKSNRELREGDAI